MANLYYCSNGERVTEATIKSKLSKAYKSWYVGVSFFSCQGCGNPAQGTAHIIPKARCKQLHKTEFIWYEQNTFPACHRCNMIAENPSSEEIKQLHNYDLILEFTRNFDYERYQKMIL